MQVALCVSLHKLSFCTKFIFALTNPSHYTLCINLRAESIPPIVKPCWAQEICISAVDPWRISTTYSSLTLVIVGEVKTMKYSRISRVIVIALIALMVLSLVSNNTMTFAQDGGQPRRQDFKTPNIGAKSIDLSGLELENLVLRSGNRVRVTVELSAPPTATMTQFRAGLAPVISAINVEQNTALAQIMSMPLNATLLGQLRVTLNALQLEVDAAQVKRLATVPGVKAIYPEQILSRDLTVSVPKLGFPTIWTSGYDGNDMDVAVIDDGVDYKHANFGGTTSTAWVPGTGATPVDAAVEVKVVDGYDLVGDLYDARIVSGTGSTPVPDADPYTCPDPAPTPIFNPADTPVHHGTHVAGIAVGYGTTSANATFTGPWDGTVPFGTLKIGPGVAPRANLYLYRVFGCYGSTSSLIVSQAIDRAVDPNGDLDPADHVDVMNMSLGSNYGSGLSTEYNTAINNAVAAGAVVVASAGNGADSYYITGGPSASGAAIAVAGSEPYVPQVNVTAAPAASYFGSGAAFGPRFSTAGVSGDLVLVDDGISTPPFGTPSDACDTPFVNAGAIAGNIAVLDRGTCSFVVKVKNAQVNGATAAVVCNNVAGAPISMGGTDPTITIPSLMISLADCTALKTRLPVAGTTLVSSSTPDNVYGSTSRGPRRASPSSNVILKPDLAAPGSNIISSVGHNNAAAAYSGTSMAAPHVAGYTALLRQQNPTWTPQEVKALMMNTSTVDIPVVQGQPTVYGPGRIGTGRINPANAFNLGTGPKVIAYDQTAPTLVSVSFGLIEASSSTTASRVIELKNKGGTDVTYNVSLEQIVTLPGTTVSVSPSSILVPSNSTATVTLTVTTNPNIANGSYNHDASTADVQAGLLRQWLSEVSGYVRFAATGEPTLRVAYHAVPRPTSTTVANRTSVALNGMTGNFTLGMTGTSFVTGNLEGTGALYNVASMVSPFVLQYISPNEPNSYGALEDTQDIRYVGVNSDYAAVGSMAGAQVFFAIATWSDFSTMKETQIEILIDTNRDGTDDYNLRVLPITSSNVQQDVFLSSLLNLSTQVSGFQEVLNPAYGADPFNELETYTYNNNVIVVPVAAGATSPFGGAGLNLTPGQPFDYRVKLTNLRDYGVSIDESQTRSFDPSASPLDFSDAAGLAGGPYYGLPWYFTNRSSVIPVSYNLSNFSGTMPLRILLLHYHNSRTAGRTQVIGLTGPGLPDPTMGDTIGTWTPSATEFRLRNSNSAGPADIVTVFGAANLVGITGDWNNDGIDTPGTFNPANGAIRLSNNINGTGPYIQFGFGGPGDTPLVGDWNGDGADSIGVFRPVNGRIYLRNALSTGIADFQMILGGAGDVGLAGDWDGNGVDSPAVFRPSNTRFYFTNKVQNGAVTADFSLVFGLGTDIPFSGDWNGDGWSGVGLFRASQGRMFLKNDPRFAGAPDFNFLYGTSGDRPLAGHWPTPAAGPSAPIFEPGK